MGWLRALKCVALRRYDLHRSANRAFEVVLFTFYREHGEGALRAAHERMVESSIIARPFRHDPFLGDRQTSSSSTRIRMAHRCFVAAKAEGADSGVWGRCALPEKVSGIGAPSFSLRTIV